MKIFTLILITLFCLALIQAQDKILPFDGKVTIIKDDCGNHASASESQLYDMAEGKVTKVIDGNTIIVETAIKNGKKAREEFVIDLAGIESGAEARDYLIEKILNQNVRVWGNTAAKKDKYYYAIVFGNEKSSLRPVEVNCWMLQKGFAKFKEFNPANLVPEAKHYYYLQAAKKAEAEKIGVWGKPEFNTDLSMIEFEEYEPGCGDANNYGTRDGRVTKIISGNTFVLEVNDKYETETYQVEIAGVDVSSSSSLVKRLLISNLLHQTVTVTGNEIRNSNKKIAGIVNMFAGSSSIFGEVNQYLLKNGLAKYKEPKRHRVPQWTICKYPNFEAQAKSAKIGIWEKQ